jgi:hypothetical protein
VSSGVAKFGGDPENDGENMAEFADKNGSAADMLTVETMSNDRIRSALALWTAGATYGDIAAQFGFRTPNVAAMAIERALSENVDDTQDRSKLRRRMSLTLDRLLRAVMPKAINAENPEQLPAVRVALTVVERYAKLNGLDAPTQVDVNMVGDKEFTNLVELAARGMGIAPPVEADIFDPEYMDAEVVEDDDEEGDRGLAGPNPL